MQLPLRGDLLVLQQYWSMQSKVRRKKKRRTVPQSYGDAYHQPGD